MRRTSSHTLLLLLVSSLIVGLSSTDSVAQVERLTTSADGTEANGYSFSVDASDDGKFVVFDSYATNLVTGIESRARHIYLKNTVTGEVTLVTKGVDGKPANAASERPHISADGRFVVYDSNASNLVEGDTNGFRDIFLFDRDTGVTEKISRGGDGSATNEDSWESDVSDDGQTVVFSSFATNVVPNDTNKFRDIFTLDRATATVSRINLTATGKQSEGGRSRLPSMSGDGKFVAFVSQATNLASGVGGDVHVLLCDVAKRSSITVSSSARVNTSPVISGDGRFVVYLSQRDLNPPHIMLFDRVTSGTKRWRVDVSSDGVQGTGISLAPVISRSGRYAAFVSYSKELSSELGTDPGIFVHDIEHKATGSVRVGSGVAVAGEVGPLAFSNKDARILFISDASNLVKSDMNARPDVFSTDVVVDFCPSDPAKVEPGLCGCGKNDGDSDNDGAVDCKDECPNDSKKTAEGRCGCGVADSDADGDGIADCIDSCPNDPKKQHPGVCGCGAADADSDGDGSYDCEESCPQDPNKASPGICGCGKSDKDSDFDFVADCKDECPADRYKQSPGTCGCGRSDFDTDGDSSPDCIDKCPWSGLKTEPGECGCYAEDDANRDGIIDCKPTPTPAPTSTPTPLPPSDPSATPTPEPTPTEVGEPTPTPEQVPSVTPSPSGPTPVPTGSVDEADPYAVPKPTLRVGRRFLWMIFSLAQAPKQVSIRLSTGRKILARKNGSRMTVTLPRPASGTYAVSYTVVFKDGVKVKGRLALTVAKKVSVRDIRR